MDELLSLLQCYRDLIIQISALQLALQTYHYQELNKKSGNNKFDPRAPLTDPHSSFANVVKLKNIYSNFVSHSPTHALVLSAHLHLNLSYLPKHQFDQLTDEAKANLPKTTHVLEAAFIPSAHFLQKLEAFQLQLSKFINDFTEATRERYLRELFSSQIVKLKSKYNEKLIEQALLDAEQELKLRDSGIECNVDMFFKVDKHFATLEATHVAAWKDETLLYQLKKYFIDNLSLDALKIFKSCYEAKKQSLAADMPAKAEEVPSEPPINNDVPAEVTGVLARFSFLAAKKVVLVDTLPLSKHRNVSMF